MKIEEISLGDEVGYKGKIRKVSCVDLVENLLGLEPTIEPLDIVWVRYESCDNLTIREIPQMEGTIELLDKLKIR